MNSFETDLGRAVGSIRFFLGVALQLAVLLSQGPDSTLYQMSVPLACALPYAAGWLDEYKGGFVKLALVRSTMRGYIWGKFFACTVSGGWAETLAMWLFCAVKGGRAPACGYGALCLCAMVWAAVAAVLAALSGSRYLAYGGAFVIYYFLVILCERYWPGLYCLYPYEWLRPQHTWVFGNAGIVLMLAGFLTVLGLWHYMILQRRVERA